MIRLLGKIPKPAGHFYVAVSGGVDSMVAYDFFEKGEHDPVPFFFNHKTETSKKALKFLMDTLGGVAYEEISGNKPKSKSWEEWWRDERMQAFHKQNLPIVTAHHLSDCIETWIWGSIHGQPKLVPYQNKNIIRPFLLTPKSEILNWSKRHKVSFLEDESNKDVKFQRNRIRHNLMPEILKINPGIEKTIAKRVFKSYQLEAIKTSHNFVDKRSTL